ncbi:hypothetical protein HanHA89_Chr05g0209291 [Helianthus annuus]|nr:hypothetical protein HanHA89_Chr05g0209291 [Helianthus annuus]
MTFVSTGSKYSSRKGFQFESCGDLEFMLEQAMELLDHLENVLANEPVAFQRG